MDTETKKNETSASEDPEQPPSRRSIYRGVKDELWNDWRWQMANRLTTIEDIKQKLDIKGLEETNYTFPIAITPYYATLLVEKDVSYPLCKAVIPSKEELIKSFGEEDDPLHEEDMSPIPGLIHRYPDRVLYLITGICASYCRYCTRSRSVGHAGYDFKNLDAVVKYLEEHPKIRDVIISGGDPLTMSNTALQFVLDKIRSVKTIEIIRIGTKVPVVIPQRITPELVQILKKYHPLYINIHFTHPDEITPEVEKACALLVDNGFPLGSQTVLLKGINDDSETMKSLMLKLLKMRIKPYYLYQCDPITGSKHFRTPVEKGIEIIDELQGYISGFGIPKFVVDAPGGGGKIPISQSNILGKLSGVYKLKNYQGRIYEYPLE
jgi:lysine 2,3-aminomutase